MNINTYNILYVCHNLIDAECNKNKSYMIHQPITDFLYKLKIPKEAYHVFNDVFKNSNVHSWSKPGIVGKNTYQTDTRSINIFNNYVSRPYSKLFDVVVLMFCPIYQLEDDELLKIFKGIHRLLKPNGILRMPSEENFAFIKNRLGKVTYFKKPNTVTKFNTFTYQQISLLAKK